MEIEIKGILFNAPDNIEEKLVKVNDKNALLVRKKLESERLKIIVYLKNLVDIGQIKSIRRPKSKPIQYQLDKIIVSKRIISNSLEKVKTVFF